MNNSKIVLLINDKARAMMGSYDSVEKDKIFKTLDPNIKVGDFVVVESTTRHNMTVVEVTEADIDVDFDKEETVRWIIQKIDDAPFKNMLEQEKEAIAAVHSAERRRKKEQLRASLFADHQERLKALPMADMDDSDVTDE